MSNTPTIHQGPRLTVHASGFTEHVDGRTAMLPTAVEALSAFGVEHDTPAMDDMLLILFVYHHKMQYPENYV